MTQASGHLRDAMVAYCTRAGADPLLVQGAGGNVSWKEGDTLWIKASGTWLADASQRDIFVPVDLPHLQQELAAGRHESKPQVKGEHALRPSIETVLHALMPHKVVVHLHAIEVLAHLVREDFTESLRRSGLQDAFDCAMVDYHKPGVALARAVQTALAQTPSARVVFMRNHGVVVGGDDVDDVERVMHELVARFKTVPLSLMAQAVPTEPLVIGDAVYRPLQEFALHQLATDPRLYGRLAKFWALYPDHVVFLGARASLHASVPALTQVLDHQADAPPELVFVQGLGVFARESFSVAKSAQLRCYLDVLARQPADAVIRALTMDQIAELLDWDAERYRQAMAK
jgi:rhamnose utilization protein RhaD (predicted bifunctional aldolase and dehydrogenase)